MPQRLLLEAGLELLVLGTITAIVVRVGLPQLSASGFVVAALGYAATALYVIAGLGRHAPNAHFGPANAITLCRAALNIVLLTVVAEELLGTQRMADSVFRWTLAAAAATALMLDGADGWVARRTRMASGFGERFDMETDGVFLLAMALLLATAGIVGPWVLASGLVFYVFRLAGLRWPVLTAPLPPRMRRKAICVAQGASLAAALAPGLPPWAAPALCLAGIAALLYSFAVDLAWLLRPPPTG